MKTDKRPFYVGYHHLTYACFGLVLLQMIFLVAIQAINQRTTANVFFEEKPYILYTLKSNLEALDYTGDKEALLSQIKSRLYPKLSSLTSNIDITPDWQMSNYDEPDDLNTESSNFYLTNYLSNPYIIQIDFPKQETTLYIEFRVSLGLFWSSFLVSIFVMMAFLIAWVIFVYAFNIGFKSRIIQGFALSREQQRSRAPGDLTGELIHEIQGLMDEKNLMLSALSHDLKTPLTELELKLYLLEDQELASQLLHNAHDITQIVKTSLQYAKGFEHVEKETYNLIEFIGAICKQADTPKKPVTFKTDLKSCYFNIENTLFKRLLANLIMNAKKYADNCDLTLGRNFEEKLFLVVEDNGPGVPQEQLDMLGNPFFRADTSRSRKTGGTGLGLAIVKQVAKMHGLFIKFENKLEGGLKITLIEM